MSTATAKRCVNCNKDVTSDKRMRDSSGQYWCMKCGEADRLKKGQSGVPCASCGDRYPADKLTRFGKDKICPSCYRQATRGNVSFGAGGGEGGKGRLIKMLIVMGILALGCVWRFMTLH